MSKNSGKFVKWINILEETRYGIMYNLGQEQFAATKKALIHHTTESAELIYRDGRQVISLVDIKKLEYIGFVD